MEIAWPGELWSEVEHLGPARSDQWERAMLYLKALDPEFPAVDDALGETDEHRQRLRRLLAELGSRVEVVSGQLKALLSAQGLEPDGEHVELLTHLGELALVGDEVALRRQAELLFDGERGFQSAMQQWHGWNEALEAVPQLVEALEFLERASIPEECGELSTEGELLHQRLRSPRLAASPRQWTALVEAVRLFRRRYAVVYIRHHEAYHDQMGILGHRMNNVRLQARALEKLNGIPDLGEAVALHLAGLAEELHNNVVACDAKLERPDVERSPRCPQCGLRLASDPPTQEVELLAGYVHDALRQQNQRLSQWVVRRMVRREPGSRLQRFINVVQISDLSGLANVLDDELVGFIRELLQE